MKDKVLTAVIRAGGSPAGDALVSWNEAVIETEVQPSGLAAFAVVATAPPATAVTLLETNPATGWCWGILPDGRAARRRVLSPLAWLSADRLAAELDRLVAGEPSTADAACCEPLFPLLDADSSEIDHGVGLNAIAVLLLRRNGRALDRTRYVLAGQGLTELDDIHVAGKSAEAIARRIAADVPVVDALIRNRHIATAALQLWTAGTAETFTDHPAEGARQETTHA